MNPVRLHTGEVVDSSSDAWLHECEADAILGFPNKAARINQLKRVEQRRGAAERKRLEFTIMALWRARRRRAGI